MPKKRTPAKSILQTKVVLHNGVIVEMKIWEVPKDERYPLGYKYSLYATHDGQVLVGYDNHHPKDHHRHIGNQEFPYHFIAIENLKNDFKADLEVQLGKADLK
jgi:hypothetical protein